MRALAWISSWRPSSSTLGRCIDGQVSSEMERFELICDKVLAKGEDNNNNNNVVGEDHEHYRPVSAGSCRFDLTSF